MVEPWAVEALRETCPGSVCLNLDDMAAAEQLDNFLGFFVSSYRDKE
jgi:hypothetical protein